MFRNYKLIIDYKDYKTMLSKILPITIIFSMVLLITSCSSQPTTTKITGSNGLNIKFLSLPDKAYYNTNLPLALDIKDVGASDVKYIITSLDYNPLYFDFTPAQEGVLDNIINIDLLGRHKSYSGTHRVVALGKLSVKKDLFSEKFSTIPTDITATVCYPYRTILEESVCVGSPYSKQCLRQSFTYGSQGAPVAVKKLEVIPSIEFVDEETAKFSITVLITIQNIGKGFPLAAYWGINWDDLFGSVFTDDYEMADFQNACSQAEQQGVWVRALLSTTDLNCNPENVPLIGGEGFVTCKLPNPITITSEYKAPLTIVLGYYYIQDITKSVDLYNPEV